MDQVKAIEFDIVSDGISIAGFVVGVVGGVTGVIGLVLSKRNLAAANRSAKAAEDSAVAGAQSAHAAERAATAAEESALEARRLSTVETGRRHDELGPGLPDVRFIWGPGRPQGAVWAEITNHQPHDVDLQAKLVFDTGAQDLDRRVIHAGTTERVYVAQLDVPGINAEPEGFDDQREALRRLDQPEAAIRQAYQAARGQFGDLELWFRSVGEVCVCPLKPPGDTYGHWITHHQIDDVGL